MALQLFKIETVEVASPVASVTFSSIPQGYTDLMLKVSARNVSGIYVFDYLNIAFNGSSADYTLRTLEGDGSSPFTATRSLYTVNLSARISGASATNNIFCNTEIYIPQYRSSNYKSISGDYGVETNATTTYLGLIAGLWSQTAAITSLTFSTSVSSIGPNSTFTLYGIL